MSVNAAEWLLMWLEHKSGDPSVSLLVISDKKNITRLVGVRQNHFFIEAAVDMMKLCPHTVVCGAVRSHSTAAETLMWQRQSEPRRGRAVCWLCVILVSLSGWVASLPVCVSLGHTHTHTHTHTHYKDLKTALLSSRCNHENICIQQTHSFPKTLK